MGAEQPKPKVIVAAPYLPPAGLAGNSAVGIFFAQHCPGYITEAERQLIHTASQLNARESWSTVNDIETSLFSAAKANQTNPNQELFSWCIAAEPRIWTSKVSWVRNYSNNPAHYANPQLQGGMVVAVRRSPQRQSHETDLTNLLTDPVRGALYSERCVLAHCFGRFTRQGNDLPFIKCTTRKERQMID